MDKSLIFVVPIYNEEKVLKDSVLKLHDYFTKNLSLNWKIVIANNGSTDDSKLIAEKLSKKYKNVLTNNLLKKGRGLALRDTWSSFDADVYAYCDIDLATDINQIKTLIDQTSKYSVVTGSRYLKDSHTIRNHKRLVLSKGYNQLVKLFFKTKVSDFQCGFKAINKNALKMLSNIKDNEWFFDTELLLLSEKYLNVYEIPVNWSEDSDSKVKIIKTIWQYISKLVELRFRTWTKKMY